MGNNPKGSLCVGSVQRKNPYILATSGNHGRKVCKHGVEWGNPKIGAETSKEETQRNQVFCRTTPGKKEKKLGERKRKIRGEGEKDSREREEKQFKGPCHSLGKEGKARGRATDGVSTIWLLIWAKVRKSFAKEGGEDKFRERGKLKNLVSWRREEMRWSCPF